MLIIGMAELAADFDSTIEAYRLSLQSAGDEGSEQMLQSIQALKQNIEIMQRLQSDKSVGKVHALEEKEISEIADFALNLLDQVATGCASRGLQDEMLQLHRYSMPVVIWLSQNGGQLKKLDIVVNAIASYANTLQDTQQLEQLCQFIQQVVRITDQKIKADKNDLDPMRPWRILNLNWGIVATRTHNTELMQQVFEQLIKNIPNDVQQFFSEGLQQMQIVDYPQPVKETMQAFAEKVGSAGRLH